MQQHDSLGYLIHHTDMKVSNLLYIKFKPHDVTPGQWRLLRRLSDEDGINQKELSIRVGKNQTIVARMLDILERKGYVRRDVNPDDRRAYFVHLTDAGDQVQRKLRAIAQATVDSVVQDIAPGEIALVHKILAQIYDNAKTKIAETQNTES